MGEHSLELLQKREYRRKRRIRNQIIAGISTAVLLAGIVVGVAVGIKYLIGTIEDKKPESLEAATTRQEETLVPEEPVAVETPEEYEEEVRQEQEPEKSPLDSVVDTCISELPLEDKIAGLFFITPEALTEMSRVIQAGEATKEKLREYAVGGLIYFSDNIRSGEQLTEMLKNTKSMSKYPIFLGVDEEGGKVTRVASKNLGEKVDSMGSIGKTGDTQKAYTACKIIGTYLSEFGFTTDFAPVADVASDEESKILGDRSFGTGAEQVAEMVSFAVGGLRDTGIHACLKHFPGLGNTTVDTHEGMAITERTLEEMRAVDFLPFKAGIDAGAEFVMVGHVSAPNITGDNTPASLSSKLITEILREELGFNGVVITDALNMGAITEYYTSGEVCMKALQAGADMLLMPENFREAYEDVFKAVRDGTISEERIDQSLRRIYRVKYAKQVIE